MSAMFLHSYPVTDFIWQRINRSEGTGSGDCDGISGSGCGGGDSCGTCYRTAGFPDGDGLDADGYHCMYTMRDAPGRRRHHHVAIRY